MLEKLNIDWQKVNNLLPVIVQDGVTSDVLMLAYMNEQALELSINTGFAHYFSRTKSRIWKKGESSGNTQKILSASLDCDNDTLLIKVIQNGGSACHTGAKSCFFNSINLDEVSVNLSNDILINKPSYNIIDEIYHVILDRKLHADPQNSYVASLFNKGENSILKKVGEEAAEFIMSSKDVSKVLESIEFENDKLGKISKNIEKNLKDFIKKDTQETENITSIVDMLTDNISNLNKILQKNKDDMIYEAADLYFHVLIALCMHNIHPDRINLELARRFGISGIDEKNSRIK